jgi:eukaryotic-like serine/threonine-protein kinase
MIETLGRYKVIGVIGQGAMGTVYKAVDPMIDRTVAIKTINLSLNSEELVEYEARFQQEIKAAGRLNHPNIVTIYDVGRTDTVAYMAMEFLEGRELKDLLTEQGRPSTYAVVDWIAQAAEGLGFAHKNDVIHRDVKPSNIMVVGEGLAKITDFGIARTSASAVKTMTGMILGSPRYMSPEQVIGKKLDYRTDIFSLGVVLYEALTGHAPFDGDNVNAIMYATVNTEPITPSSQVPGVPQILDLIVAKALAKTVDERYQSMSEFARDLRGVLTKLGGNLSPESARAAGKTTPTTTKTDGRTSSLNTPQNAPRFNQAPEGDESVKPLKLAKNFDSFDATLKLAAHTDQTGEFQGYISETKKMRAYSGDVTGKIEADIASSQPTQRKSTSQAGNMTMAVKPLSETAKAHAKPEDVARATADKSRSISSLNKIGQVSSAQNQRDLTQRTRTIGNEATRTGRQQTRRMREENTVLPMLIMIGLAMLAVGLTVALIMR